MTLLGKGVCNNLLNIKVKKKQDTNQISSYVAQYRKSRMCSS